MQDDKWDEEMRQLFDEVEEEYDPASWQQLSDYMDTMESEEEADQLFDNTVKDKLQPYQDHSAPKWEQMAAALVVKEERRRSIITTKSLEAIILLLLFFTLWNYRSHTVLDINLDKSYVNTIKVENQVLENVMADIEHSVSEEESSIQANIEKNQALISAKKNEFYKRVLQGITTSALNAPKLVLPREQVQLATISETQIKIASIPAIVITPLNTDFIVDKALMVATAVDKKTETKPSYNGWSAGITQSYDINFVNSDITLGYLGDQIGSGLSGHSITLNIGRRIGPIEINSGLGYAAKSYAPGLHTKYQKASANSSAFLQSQLDEISFKQIHIPLSVKLFVAPKQRTSFYLVTGVVANVLLETDYSILRTIQANARPATDPRANIIDLDSPPLGLSNGGSIKDNFYATGMIGFGVQSYLNNGVSWFIQPQYQHTLKQGINEVANEINTLSFSAGLSFTL